MARRGFKIHCRFCMRRLDADKHVDGCDDCAKRNAQLVPIYHEIIAVYPHLAKYSMPMVFAKLWMNWKRTKGITVKKPRNIPVNPLKVF